MFSMNKFLLIRVAKLSRLIISNTPTISASHLFMQLFFFKINLYRGYVKPNMDVDIIIFHGPGITQILSGIPGLTEIFSGNPGLAKISSGNPGITKNMDGNPGLATPLAPPPY